MNESLPDIGPVLAYEDAAGAIEWLMKALGFREHLIVPGDDDTITHAELRLGAGVVMLTSARPYGPFPFHSPKASGTVTASTYIRLDDIDAHYERARAAGVEVVRELAETSYGSREYSARDPEGHLWHFGDYRPGGEA